MLTDYKTINIDHSSFELGQSSYWLNRIKRTMFGKKHLIKFIINTKKSLLSRGGTLMVIARGEFIYELEKNVEFRQRQAELGRLKREKEEAARKFMEEYNRIIGQAAEKTEIAIDKKLTEMGLKSAGDIDELKFQVIYEMPSHYGVVTNNPDKRDGGSRTSNYVKLMKDVVKVLTPKYESQGWHLTHRHIKGGIFIFTIE